MEELHGNALSFRKLDRRSLKLLLLFFSLCKCSEHVKKDTNQNLGFCIICDYAKNSKDWQLVKNDKDVGDAFPNIWESVWRWWDVPLPPAHGPAHQGVWGRGSRQVCHSFLSSQHLPLIWWFVNQYFDQYNAWKHHYDEDENHLCRWYFHPLSLSHWFHQSCGWEGRMWNLSAAAWRSLKTPPCILHQVVLDIFIAKWYCFWQ